MSRLGKKPIIIPEGIEVKIENGKVNVGGPKGELVKIFKDSIISIDKKDGCLELRPKKENTQSAALWGTYASHLTNMIEGVISGFSKNLLIEGIGYKAQIDGSGKKLILNLGFSHPVEMVIPEGISVKVEKNKMEISGIDKELVGETAARIRALKKPEPYKGKGIRYENEVIRRKAGKKAVGAG
ncbi:50S ribosomal protein L6 [Patescibacteria group bacterium]|nr:50S ribosomal protein L6 [Patescibacteria group bacterium]